MNALEKTNDNAKLIATLRSSLYPMAREDSIEMVLEYCRAAKLDVMLKPVHIVEMSVKTNQKDKEGKWIYEKRDVIMPGINLYRTMAARSGCAGISEPEYGEDIIACLGGVDITYPKWCKITVKRIIKGHIVEFTAKEYWLENYAQGESTYNKSTSRYEKTAAPNAMWKKRPYAQLAKCAEAQALRKAFPEIGAQPTAEEMEGKHFDGFEMEVEKNKLISGKGVNGVKQRLELENNSAVTSQAETGEIIDAEVVEEDSAPASADTITFLIENAETLKDLMDAMKHLKDLPTDAKKEVYATYKKKEAELKNN